MGNCFVRKSTRNERLHMAMDDHGCNMTMRCLLELDRKPPAQMVNNALKKVLSVHQGINLKHRRGKWYISDFIPEYKIITTTGNPYLLPINNLDYHKNTVSVSEIYSESTDRSYMCVELFHGASDGRGLMEFVYDFFSVLRGESIEEGVFDMTDIEVVKQSHFHKKMKIPFSPTSTLKRFKENRCERNRFSVSVPYKGGFVTGKLACAAAMLAENNKAPFMIPVDIRHFVKNQENRKKHFLSNLVLPLFMECGGKSASAIQTELKEAVNLNNYLADNTVNPVSMVPSFVFPPAMNVCFHILSHTRGLPLCGLVSNLGKIDKQKFINPFFEVNDMFFLIESNPFCQFNISSVTWGDRVNVNVAFSPKKVTEEAVFALEKNIRNLLEA